MSFRYRKTFECRATYSTIFLDGFYAREVIKVFEVGDVVLSLSSLVSFFVQCGVAGSRGHSCPLDFNKRPGFQVSLLYLRF